jgi:hypothetical protein
MALCNSHEVHCYMLAQGDELRASSGEQLTCCKVGEVK